MLQLLQLQQMGLGGRLEELREDKFVDVVGVSDEENIADIFTKCLRSAVFKHRVEQIRGYQAV